MNQKATYILKSIVEKFVKKFYANLTQGHNGATVLVKRQKKKYIVHVIYTFAQ